MANKNKNLSLIDAYAAVYDENLRNQFQEEKQKAELDEFLYAVDLLVSEGYDFSEYTYDELYEDYICEGVVGTALKDFLGALKSGGKTFWSAAKPEIKQSIGSVGKTVGKYAVPVGAAAALDQFFTGGKGREYTGAAVQGVRQLGHSIPSPDQLGKSVQPFVDKPPALSLPSSSPSTPTSTPSTQPSSTTVLAKKGGQTGEKDLTTGQFTARDWSPEESGRYAFFKSKQANSSSGSTTGLNQSFDIFDVVAGYLLDEGYADTPEAAIAIMSNMSEEWRQSIIEQF